MTNTRLALFGTPGAGKSTCSHLLELICRERAIGFYRVKLAEPLYDCQAAIYEIAGRPLADRYQQDGELLNFLGTHLRRINASVLIDAFRQRVDRIAAEQSGRAGPTLAVCDDMRALDAPHLRDIGFTFVRVIANPALCRERRMGRGDASLGSEMHPTERGLDGIEHDHAIMNEGTLDDLRAHLDRLVGMLWP